MILSVSNIAWSPKEKNEAYDLLAERGLRGLEIAPGLFFHDVADPFCPDAATANIAISQIEKRGLSLVSMQSLLFGSQGAFLLGDPDSRFRFEREMIRAIELAGRFGIPNLVFGSPDQRNIPTGMTFTNAWARAADTFHRLGDRAASEGTRLAIEPSPAVYGTTLLATLDETVAFVAEVEHPAVQLTLDLGAARLDGSLDTIGSRLPALVSMLGHVHVSEPNLAPAPDDGTDLGSVLKGLKMAEYKNAVSIEMRRPDGGLAVLRERVGAMIDVAERILHD